MLSRCIGGRKIARTRVQNQNKELLFTRRRLIFGENDTQNTAGPPTKLLMCRVTGLASRARTRALFEISIPGDRRKRCNNFSRILIYTIGVYAGAIWPRETRDRCAQKSQGECQVYGTRIFPLVNIKLDKQISRAN
jgi:hypothetical protein